MTHLLSAVISGLLFGLGLVVSDMVNPQRVIAFLDVSGQWDPSLAFVLGGALLPSWIGYRIRKNREKPFLDGHFHVPTNRKIDPQLIGGAIIFGLGWGLVGLCPGPALAGLVAGRWEIGLFVISMATGMYAYKHIQPMSHTPGFSRIPK